MFINHCRFTDKDKNVTSRIIYSPTVDELSRLLQVIGGRVLQALLTILGASVVIWALLPLAPGDPALRLLQARGVQDPQMQEIAAVRQEWGLDQPLHLQYVRWLSRAVRGDLSTSYQTGRPVLAELGKRLPVTLRLTGLALVIALTLSVIGALVGTAYWERWPDQLLRFLTQIGASTPSFLIGLLALQYIVVGLGIGQVLSGGETRLILLPALTLAVGRTADWSQLLRANLLDAIGANYTFVAAARGATKVRVLVRYALPNAALPFFTAVGVGIGGLIGGAAIVEAVFTWPGIGSYVLAAISARDFPVVQGFVVISVLAYVVASLLVDLGSVLLDPRIRAGDTA